MTSDLRGNISGAKQHPQQPGGVGNQGCGGASIYMEQLVANHMHAAEPVLLLIILHKLRCWQPTFARTKTSYKFSCTS